MRIPTRPLALVLLAAAGLLAHPQASFAQVRVIISGGFSAAYRELLPQFEKTTGLTVTTTSGGSVGNGANTIPNQIRRGVAADVVILAREGLRELIQERRIVPGTDTDLARSTIGMVVRAGAPRPDISTVDNLRQVLLSAKSVAMSSSTSGVYLTTTLFPRLGIAAQMAPKSTMAGAAAVGRGEAEIGLQQVSELLPIEGTAFVGALPEDVQYVTVYAAAVVAGSTNADAATRLIAFLSSGEAAGAITRSGMEVPRRR
ncbi:MAG TPA: substrate-binding domain-containing protein [Vicinamibacterales bacterium]|nr:substrate-binding domain-containing protein [Vicinamibacterales bacterium]